MLKPVVLLAFALSFAPSLAQAGTCPVINGRYERIVERDGRWFKQKYFTFTRVERGVFSYVVDKEMHFQVADGVARRIGEVTGTMPVYCGDNSVVHEALSDEENVPYRIEATPLSETELKVEQSDRDRSGIYLKVP